MIYFLIFSVFINLILLFLITKNRTQENNNRKKISDEYVRGLNYLISQENDKALDMFISAVNYDDDNIETHIILGNLYRNRGEVNRAIRIRQNIIARPDLDESIKFDCMFELAKDFHKAGLLDRSENILSQLINDNKRNSDLIKIYELLSSIYEQEREWGKASKVIQDLQNLSKKDYSDMLSHYQCELAENEFSKYNENSASNAILFAEKSLSYKKDSIRAKILLGDIYFFKKDYDKSFYYYTSSFEQNPSLGYLFVDKIKEIITKTNDNNILSKLEKIFSLHPNYSYFNEQIKISDSLGSEYIAEITSKALEKGDHSFEILEKYVDLILEGKIAADNESIQKIKSFISLFSKYDNHHICGDCGFSSKRHYWQCPGCKKWSTISRVKLKDHIDNDTYVIK